MKVDLRALRSRWNSWIYIIACHLLKGYHEKMADIDIDPFGEHESRPDEQTGENIPLTPVGGSTWEPEHEQETSFGGTSQRTRLVREYVKDLYQKLSENMNQTPEAFHSDYFKLEDGKLYYRGRNKPLTTEGELRSVGKIAEILGKNRLRNLGFDIPKGKLTAQQAVMLNRVKEELPSTSDITKADDIELQEITENASKSTEDLISQMKNDQSQTDDLFKYPLHELLGLDKQLRSIKGSLKVQVTKKVQLEEHIKKEKCKLEEFRQYPGVNGDDQLEEIRNRTERLSDDLKVRQESIDLLKGRLTNQITSFKETIAKVLDKDTSLATKIRTLFREQGITIVSILTAIRMAIGVLVEALLPGGGGGATSGCPPPKDKDMKEWLRNKLKALASLLGRLGVKAAEVLPGIIGAIISWILNRAADVVGWVSQNLWVLVVGVGGLLYTYMVTK